MSNARSTQLALVISLLLVCCAKLSAGELKAGEVPPAVEATPNEVGGYRLSISRGIDGEKIQRGVGAALLARQPDSELFFDRASGTISVRRKELASESSGTLLWTGTIQAIESFGRAAVGGLKLSWEAQEAESIYGLGERFNGFDQYGKKCEMWILDVPGGCPDLSTSYFCAPVVYSSRGYGLFAESNPEGVFNFNSNGCGSHSYARAGESLALHIVFGNNLKELVRKRGVLFGPFRGIPDWAWGPWISRNSYETQNQAIEVLEAMFSRHLPVAVIVQEAWKGLSDKGHFHDFSPTRWPNTDKYFEHCKEHDVRTALWQVPILHPSSPHYQKAAESGYLVRDPQGNVSHRENWLKGFANIDFTSREACQFWANLLRDEVRMGVCSFKVDDGEDIKPTDLFSDERRGWAMHNDYSTLYNLATMKAFDDEGVEGLLWARSGSVGIEQSPALWAGDQYATWEQMRSLLPAGLSTSISGMPFWGHDIGGYMLTPSRELYMRWLQFGTFSPLMQYHGITPREPWFFGKTAEKCYAFLTSLRMALRPTLISLGKEAASTGIPIMRPMTMEFPNDPRFVAEETQYMLGPDLLVAPILEEGAAGRSILIPEGKWQHLLYPLEYDGPAEIELPVGYLDTPVLVRHGAALEVELEEGADWGEWHANAGHSVRRFDSSRAVVRNLQTPVGANALRGSARVGFECDEDVAEKLVIRASKPGDGNLANRPILEGSAGHYFFRLPTSNGIPLNGLRQKFAILLRQSTGGEQVLFAGSVQWESPISMASQVRGPVVVEPGTYDLVTTLSNTSDKPVDLVVHARSTPAEQITPESHSLALPPFGNAEVSWKASVTAVQGVLSTSIEIEAVRDGLNLANNDLFLSPPLTWAVVGPFTAPAQTAHHLAYPPEWSIDAHTCYQSQSSILQWKQVAKESVLEQEGLNFHALCGRTKEAAAYAFTRIWSEEPCCAELRLGSDDTVTVWVNDQRVHDHEIYRAAEWDQEVVPVHLHGGTNTIMVKVCQEVGHWQMFARLSACDSETVPVVTDGFSDFGDFAEDRQPQGRPLRAPRPLSWYVATPLDSAKANQIVDESLLSLMEESTSWPPSMPGLHWQSADAAMRADGTLDLNRVFAGVDTSAYAAATLWVGQETPVRLACGSDDGMTLWLNGEQLINVDEPRHFRHVQHEVDGVLRQGENRILVKVYQEQGEWLLRVIPWDTSQLPYRVLEQQ